MDSTGDKLKISSLDHAPEWESEKENKESSASKFPAKPHSLHPAAKGNLFIAAKVGRKVKSYIRCKADQYRTQHERFI